MGGGLAEGGVGLFPHFGDLGGAPGVCGDGRRGGLVGFRGKGEEGAVEGVEGVEGVCEERIGGGG